MVKAGCLTPTRGGKTGSLDADAEFLADRFRDLMRRYTGATPEAFIEVLCPLLIPLRSLDKTITKLSGQSHYRASFTTNVTPEVSSVLWRGRTGKFVPSGFKTGGLWREIAKGRIVEIDNDLRIASGEVYTGGTRLHLEQSLASLSTDDLLEIDQYGAAAKVLAGLAEHTLVKHLEARGYVVRRMPEDMARHLGRYASYDFEVTRGGEMRKVEVKSLWGTNVRFARLIHSTTKRPRGDPDKWTPDQGRSYYPTSSCKFETQDIFAVSLFLRTGNIKDFAFARSVPKDEKAYGLARASDYSEHVNQNPGCEIGDGAWFGTIEEVWNLP